MEIIKIKNEFGEGSIEYIDKDFTIDFPDEDTIKEITTYLSTPKTFRIPESNQIDDFREDTVLPTDDLTYFELALCSMHSAIGVWVDW